MNKAMLFVPNFSYDDLLFLWHNIVITQKKEGWNKALNELQEIQENQSYESHLPKDVFYEIFNQGIASVLEGVSDQYINFVFDLLYVELLKNNEYDRVQIGEFLLLRDLFYCFRHGGLLYFEGLISAFASSEMNQKISTKFVSVFDESEFF